MNLKINDGVWLKNPVTGLMSHAFYKVTDISTTAGGTYRIGNDKKSRWVYERDLELDQSFYMTVLSSIKPGDMIEKASEKSVYRYLILSRIDDLHFSIVPLGCAARRGEKVKKYVKGTGVQERNVRALDYNFLTSERIGNLIDIMEDIPYDGIGD